MKAVALNRVALVLSFLGIYVSGVLSIGAYFAVSIPCGASHGCDQVALHPSSRALGIPNAYIGFLAYVVLTMLAFWRLASPGGPRWPLTLAYAMTAIGALASLILTYISFAMIHATCLWCLTSTGIMIVLLIVHSLLVQSDAQTGEQRGMGDNLTAVALTLACLIALGIHGKEMAQASVTSNVDPRKLMDAKPETILPADAHVYGNPDAPIAIVEFGDLLCPLCKIEFPKVQQYIGEHPVNVKYVFRHSPMLKLKGHEQAAPAAIASEIAFEKGLFWQFLAAMYSKDPEQLKQTDDILQIGQGLGLDPEKTLARIRDSKDPAFQRMMRDITDAGKLGVHETPTFFIVAKGVPVRASTVESLFDDLDRPEYRSLKKGG